MRSFFKLIQIPAPRIISLPNKLSKQELINKIASETVLKLPKFTFGKLPTFVGEVYDDGFQVVMYSNSAPQKILKPSITIPVNVNGIDHDPTTNEIQIKISIVKSQMTLLKLMNWLFLLWWPLWTLGTLLSYPFIVKHDGTIFTSAIMMPFGVIIVPLLWLELSKSPERSLQNAQDYILQYARS